MSAILKYLIQMRIYKASKCKCEASWRMTWSPPCWLSEKCPYWLSSRPSSPGHTKNELRHWSRGACTIDKTTQSIFPWIQPAAAAAELVKETARTCRERERTHQVAEINTKCYKLFYTATTRHKHTLNTFNIYIQFLTEFPRRAVRDKNNWTAFVWTMNFLLLKQFFSQVLSRLIEVDCSLFEALLQDPTKCFSRFCWFLQFWAIWVRIIGGVELPSHCSASLK